MDDELLQALKHELNKRNQADEEKQYREWCQALDEIPSDFIPRLKGRLKPDLELQPRRWLSHAMSIIESANVTGHVQLMDGRTGEPFSVFLPYPVFQMGTETFLKGMLLCRFAECRRVAHNSYINPQTRARYLRRLMGFGHDLLKLIRDLRQAAPYRRDTTIQQFLQRIEAIVRYYYHPLYEADHGSWAAARYPKRFYDDMAKTASADAFKSYPEQRAVLRLFQAMERYLDARWQITRGLAERHRARRLKRPTT